MKKIKDIETALALFESSCIKNAEATEKDDYKTGNKAYHNIQASVDYLKEQGHILRLTEYLNHDSVGCQIWAARYLLSVREGDAVLVLENIAKGSGMVAFNAEITLKEWRKGNLKP